MKLETSSAEESLAIVKRAFYLAWKAIGGPSSIMGCLQDRGEVSEDEVWRSVLTAGNYPGRNMWERPGEAYGDYVFGRMMKLSIKYDASSVAVPDSEPRRDYQAWCHRYPTYLSLIEAAASDLGLLKPQTE